MPRLRPPDIDPDDKCPDGYSWSGSACFPTTGGGNENPDNPGGNTGGGDGGNNGGDGGSNPGTGNGDGGGSTGGGTGGGDGGTNGGDGPKESLAQPKQGNWDDALSTWEAKVAEAKKEFSEKIKENADQLKGVFDLNLGEGGGKLPCDTFVVWKKTVSLCFTPYEEKLSYLRYALMFMASVLAAFVILKE
ncbi:permease [Pseudomonas sp. PDM19]|uniref:permease n=1 Tax=Pseudomonas sp. PDM19 TaxID=2769272 RepID=UPI00177C8DB1|nr:permease [Pseudomonas sp. PDM19]MBD9632876.1 permease [Pseudomonas sp. PDM19]